MASRQQQGVGSFGFPTFGAPQDLMPIPQITAARALSVPTPTLSGADEESALSIILASILGSASPGIAEGLVGLLLKDRAKTAQAAPSQDIQDVLGEYSDLAAKDLEDKDLLEDIASDTSLGALPPDQPKKEHPLVARILELQELYPGTPGHILLQIASQEQYIKGTAPPEELPTKGWGRRALELGVEGALGAFALSKAGPKAGTAFATARTGAQTQRGAARTARLTGIEKRRSQAQNRLQEVIPGAFERPAPPETKKAYRVRDIGPLGAALGDTIAQDLHEWDINKGRWVTTTWYRLPTAGGFKYVSEHDPRNRARQWIVTPETEAVTSATDVEKPYVDMFESAMLQEENLIHVGRLTGKAIEELIADPGLGTLAASGLATAMHRINEEFKTFTSRHPLEFSNTETGGGSVPFGITGTEGMGTSARTIYNDLNTLEYDAQGQLTERAARRLGSNIGALGSQGKQIAQNYFTFTTWDKMAVAKARLGALQLQLAYMAAALNGQTGRTLSDRDLEYHLSIVGFGPGFSADMSQGNLESFLSTQLEKADDRWTYRNYVKEAKNKDGETVFVPDIEFDLMLNKLGGPSEDPDSKYSYEQFERAAGRAPGFSVFFQPYYWVEGYKNPFQSGAENPLTGKRDYTVDGYRFQTLHDRIQGPLQKYEWLLVPLLKNISLSGNARPSAGEAGTSNVSKSARDALGRIRKTR